MRTCLGRRGFTLIEVLVTLGIIGIVVGLTLPGVQAAREAARRAKCQSNLHQIGLALQSYEKDYGCFPVGNTTDIRVSSGFLGYYSIHARMLQYLDQSTLYNSVNFATGTSPRPVRGFDQASSGANLTALNTQLTLLLCPTDGGPLSDSGANYRGNVGVGPMNWNSIEFPDSNNGLFPESGLVRAAYVPDGLSHTAAFSERLRGSGQPSFPASDRDFWPSHGYLSTANDQLRECVIEARPGATQCFVDGGRYWFWTGREHTLYCHAQAPNGRVPDCLDLGVVTALGMATARSWHPGGVNVLMGDGSCRWVGSSIDQAVWRGFGTRNGRELVD
jgi:prepilin-type N-terminal cleavage/methylation domain-containing protein/prepilin-type processing-associated H-X9-DG protein